MNNDIYEKDIRNNININQNNNLMFDNPSTLDS